MKYEYKIWNPFVEEYRKRTDTLQGFEKEINKFGDKGWKLISTDKDNYIFMRDTK